MKSVNMALCHPIDELCVFSSSPAPLPPFRSIPGAELLPFTWKLLFSCVIVCVSSSSGAEFWGSAFPLDDAQAGTAPHEVEIISLLPHAWLSYLERRWKGAQLVLLTAGIKDVKLAEQKGSNVIFGWIRLFSLSKYHRLTRGAAEQSLWFIFALVNKGEKCFFLNIKKVFVVFHAGRILATKLLCQVYFDLI